MISASFTILKPVINQTTQIFNCSTIEPDNIVETDYLLDGIKIAESSFFDDTITASPSSQQKYPHHFFIGNLPYQNRTALLATIAQRHAELHLLGSTFIHPSKKWQNAIHALAGLIYDTGSNLPKWSTILPRNGSTLIQ
jgi:hypothetical protein